MRSVEEMLCSLDVGGDWGESSGNLPLPEYYVSYDGRGHDPGAEVSGSPYLAVERLDESLFDERPAGGALVESAPPYALLEAVCPLPILPDNIIEDLMAWKTQCLSQYIHDSMP